MRTRSRRFPTFPTASLIAAVSMQGVEGLKSPRCCLVSVISPTAFGEGQAFPAT